METTKESQESIEERRAKFSRSLALATIEGSLGLVDELIESADQWSEKDKGVVRGFFKTLDDGSLRLTYASTKWALSDESGEHGYRRNPHLPQLNEVIAEIYQERLRRNQNK